MKPTIDPFFVYGFCAKLSKLSACEIVVRLRAAVRKRFDLRRALHAPHSRGLRPGIKASLAPLRRMEASRVGCDGQLVDLRFVPCEVRPEKVFQFLDEWRLVEKLRFCITIAISSARSAFTS